MVGEGPWDWSLGYPGSNSWLQPKMYDGFGRVSSLVCVPLMVCCNMRKVDQMVQPNVIIVHVVFGLCQDLC